MITQVATGLFGVREETIQRVRIVEFKYAQGAKPGLGGHLLGDKNTPPVARMREAVAGNALFSPFPFHSVYSVEDHKKHLDWIKEVNPDCLVSVKVSTPTDVDMVAVGSYYAGAHIIHLDGSYGGTGAAPDIAKKNIAMPIEYAIPKVHKFLVAEGIRDKITLIASGGIRTAYDALKAIALGADGVVIGTAEMVALGCVRCACCESGRGCPRGIATTDPELMMQMSLEWATQRLINLHNAWREQMLAVLARLGMTSIRELRGRSDVLCYLSDEPAMAGGGVPVSDFAERLLASRSQVYSGPDQPVGSEAGGGRRLRRHRLCLHRAGERASSSTSPPSRCRTAATARAAASRRRASSPSNWASPTRCSRATTCSRSPCSIPTVTPSWSGSSSCPTSTSRCPPGSRTSTTTATSPAWRSARRTCTATWCARSRAS